MLNFGYKVWHVLSSNPDSGKDFYVCFVVVVVVIVLIYLVHVYTHPNFQRPLNSSGDISKEYIRLLRNLPVIQIKVFYDILGVFQKHTQTHVLENTVFRT